MAGEASWQVAESSWAWQALDNEAAVYALHTTLRGEYQGKVMQMSMQMKLVKLRDSDQQMGAVGEGDSSFWKTCWAGSGLASNSTKYLGGGAVGWKATGQVPGFFPTL